MSKTRNNILLVDNHDSTIKNVLGALNIDNNLIYPATSLELLSEQFAKIDPALALVNLDSPFMEGLKAISYIRQQNKHVAVIATSSNGAANIAASAIRSGATDFLELPLSAERMEEAIERSLRRMHAEIQENFVEHPIFDPSSSGFIGESRPMRDVAKLIVRAASSDASVFITGENGTGKDICAQLIHKYSDRCDEAIVPLNCAAIPHGLAESEIFGHLKGAFTGAYDDREGVVSLADKGSLFLDEIGEMDLNLQTKLLRFVQTGSFNKVGSGKLENVDVRFICATNRDPLQQIAANSFRQDLYYRLNVLHIHMPPLRERGDDVLVLARKFLQEFSVSENKEFISFSDETKKLLLNYTWPGNVREMQNIIRGIVVLHEGPTVTPSMLPLAIINQQGDRRRSSNRNFEAKSGESADLVERLKMNVRSMSSEPSKMASYFSNNISAQSPDEIRLLDEVINEAIRHAIDLCDGNVVDAANRLGVSASTLYRKIKN